MAVSKKVRFEVFKRDNFQCQYCGDSPPSVILELDHIQPRAKNGKDNIGNLITSCFDCNRGKSDRLLTSIPKTIRTSSAELKEREEQLKEYKKLLNSIKKRENGDIKKIENVFKEYFPGFCFSDKFKESIRNNFLYKFDVHELEKYMRRACDKLSHDKDNATKYFCGTLWRIIKGDSKYG